MSLRQKQNLKALVIFAVMLGAGFAAYKHSDQVQQVFRDALRSKTHRTDREADSNTSASEPDSIGSEENEQDRTSALAQSDSDETEKDSVQEEQNQQQDNTQNQNQDTSSNSEDQGADSDDEQNEQQSTKTDDKNEQKEKNKEKDKEPKTDGSDNPVTFDLSSYSEPVRRRVKRARTIYKRAQKHYSYVLNDNLSLQRRKSKNLKARALYQKTMSILDEIRQHNKADSNIQEFYKQASEMYGKCYRRAKMWAAQ